MTTVSEISSRPEPIPAGKFPDTREREAMIGRAEAAVARYRLSIEKGGSAPQSKRRARLRVMEDTLLRLKAATRT